MTLAIFDSILSILLRRRVRVRCKSILVPSDEDSGNSVVRNHMHYPLHYCDILLMSQCEIMRGYHFSYYGRDVNQIRATVIHV